MLMVRPEFFYFLFYRPSGPNVLKIENKNKRDFFSILFLYFPPTHASTVLDSNYVFLFCFFYCSQADYIAILIGKIKIRFIQTIFQLN